MSVSRNRSSRHPKEQNIVRRKNLGVILLLIFCFPLGLYRMWTSTSWPRAMKNLASLAVAGLLLAIFLPGTTPPDRAYGSVTLVDARPTADIFGPEVPEDHVWVEIYAPRVTPIIVAPTPTPVPVIVYCNDGGRYYHSADCVYVKATTPQVQLYRAIDAGYKQCPNCDAPADPNA